MHRTVWCYWRPTPTIRTLWNHSTSRLILTLCATGAKEPWYSASHKVVSLVYFSTFEPIDLTPDSIMQQAGVPMLYDSASNPRLLCLYICPVENVLGRAPLILCFIGGTVTP